MDDLFEQTRVGVDLHSLLSSGVSQNKISRH